MKCLFLTAFLICPCILAQSIDRIGSVKDYGARGDGIVVFGCSMTVGSATVRCPGARFTSGDIGKYISVASAGPSGSGLVAVILSVTNASNALLSTSASITVSDVKVVYGTDDLAAIAAVAQAICSPGNIGGTLLFPQGMYIIGQHKTFAGSFVSTAGDIVWNKCKRVTISGYGASIYIDGSFVQSADAPPHSNENTITPFIFQNASDVILEGISIFGNKDLIYRQPGVTNECLTCFAVVFGGNGKTGSQSSNYTLKDVYAEQAQTDCYYFGYRNSGNVDSGVTVQNTTCKQPARGNFSVRAAVNVDFNGVHGSLAGAGFYGGFQPYHCIDLEPGPPVSGIPFLIDNFVMHGASTCTDDIGWEFTVYSPTTVGHATVKDSVFSWSNSTKQQGFNVNSAFSEILNDRFNVAYNASANNIVAISGGLSAGHVSQLWQDNIFTDTTGAIAGVIFASGFDTDGTPNNLNVAGNTFRLNGMVINARHTREFTRNHIYWMTTGTERSGVTVVTNLEGSQSVHDNDYHTNLTAPGKSLQTFYDGGFVIPIVSNEHFLTPKFFGARCSYCYGTNVVNRASQGSN